MGRLENIIERNRHPGGKRDRISVGLTGIVLLVVVVLLVFTALDWGPATPDTPPAAEPASTRVHGIKLYRPKPAASPTATP